MRVRVLAAVAIVVALSSCEKKAEGQTVAVVNGEEITAAELNAELAGMGASMDTTGEEVRSRALQSLIDRKLLAAAARNEGIEKTPEYLNRHRRMTEDLLISIMVARQVNTAQLPPAEEIDRFQAARPGVFANREHWSLEQLRFEMPAGEDVRAQINAAKSLGELARLLESNGVPFTRANTRLDTAVIPPELYNRITALPANEPFIIPVGPNAVASVIVARESAGAAGDQARPAAVAAMRRDQGVRLMEDRAKALRETATIQYKSGFEPSTK